MKKKKQYWWSNYGLLLEINDNKFNEHENHAHNWNLAQKKEILTVKAIWPKAIALSTNNKITSRRIRRDKRKEE